MSLQNLCGRVVLFSYYSRKDYTSTYVRIIRINYRFLLDPGKAPVLHHFSMFPEHGNDCTFFVRLVAGANCRFEHSWAFTEPKRSSSKVSITSSYNANKRPRLLVSSPNNPTHYRTGSYIKLARKPNALHALLRRVADIPGWKPRLNKPLRLLILPHCRHNCRNHFYRCTLPSSSGLV